MDKLEFLCRALGSHIEYRVGNCESCIQIKTTFKEFYERRAEDVCFENCRKDTMISLGNYQFKDINAQVKQQYEPEKGFEITISSRSSWIHLDVASAEALTEMLPPLISELRSRMEEHDRSRGTVKIGGVSGKI